MKDTNNNYEKMEELNELYEQKIYFVAYSILIWISSPFYAYFRANGKTEKLLADWGHILFKRKMAWKKRFLIKLIEEGRIKSLDQVIYLNLLFTEKRFKKRVDKLLVIKIKPIGFTCRIQD